jgi:hypothetical protein
MFRTHSSRLISRSSLRRAWFAVWMMCLQALLPSVIHAASASHPNLQEICTAYGIKKILSADSSPEELKHSQTQAQFETKHCPVCSVQDSPILAAEISARGIFGTSAGNFPASIFNLSATPLMHALARAPPFIN